MKTTNEKLPCCGAGHAGRRGKCVPDPSSDPHASEYLPDHWAARSYFSGFYRQRGHPGGDRERQRPLGRRALLHPGRAAAGPAARCSSSASAWRACPRWRNTWPRPSARAGARAGRHGHPHRHRAEPAKPWPQRARSSKSVDLVEGNWEGRPPCPPPRPFLLDVKYAGLSAGEKLARLRAALAEQKAGAMVVTRRQRGLAAQPPRFRHRLYPLRPGLLLCHAGRRHALHGRRPPACRGRGRPGRAEGSA